MRVIPVTPQRLAAAAGVMARAFLDDPMMRLSMGGDLANRAALEERFTAYFEVANVANVEAALSELAAAATKSRRFILSDFTPLSVQTRLRFSETGS